MKISSKIRFAKTGDLEALIELCQHHAEYEKSEYNKAGKKEKLAADLFSNTPKLYCLVVEADNMLVGYATYMKQYATWEAREYVYMDCIYLKEFVRGLGIGQKIIARIKVEATKLRCDLIQWQTPDFNTRAIQFYKRIGAFSKSKERFFLELT